MTKKLLRVTGTGPKFSYCAGAILAQTPTGWTVEQTAPILAWMRGLAMPAIKARLEATGATWEWLDVSETFLSIASETSQEALKRAPRSSTAKSAPKSESIPVSANVSHGEQLWFDGVQNAIKNEARQKAIVRNVRGKRKDKVTEDA